MWGLIVEYRWAITIGIIALVPVVAITLFLSTLQLTGNFHEIIPGEYYRSAQPTVAKLDRYITTYGIKTVINLRGKNASDQWYRDEMAETQRLGVKFVDFKMSARKQLTDTQVEKLLEILHDAPKPILVHCKSGSDRTGLVSAIYLYKIAGRSESESEKQISFRYGHIGIPYISEAIAMDRNWERLEKSLAAGS
jgi:protein tyrosine/serine phosphatase